MSSNPRPRLIASERGQTMPFVVIMLPVLMLFVALVANVGQAVNRRVAIQMVADTSAYTGATVMAVGANNIAWSNRQIQNSWVGLTYATQFFWLYPNYSPCWLQDIAVPAYKGLHWGFRAMNGVFNRLTVLRAIVESGRVATGESGNLPDLFPGEHPGEFRVDGWPMVGRFPGPLFELVPLQEVEDGAEPAQTPGWNRAIPGWLRDLVHINFRGHKQKSWSCALGYAFGLPVPRFRSDRFNLWYRAAREPGTFLVRASAPPVPARMFPRIFGDLPTMAAIAAARPEGGSIEEGRDEYVVRMVPVSSANPFRMVDPTNWRRLIFH